ncbi:hypothetical protein CTE05_20750 [Cellulomonas terrae]|uniref:Uncharacterized protein n=1 Tax=Cellulomonas terrae TaxID=311234 RepID=A0A511JKJ5_9CELL|nr:hypothetical protein CTE05_20750 [Cellulomonas terrae]
MGMTAHVRDFRGEILDRGGRDVRELVDAARRAGLPFLANVDEYDDTVFNRMQAAVVADELHELSHRGLGGPIFDEVLQMIGRTQERPHRYLVFNGD